MHGPGYIRHGRAIGQHGVRLDRTPAGSRGKVQSYDDKSPLQVAGVHQTVLIDPFKPPCAFQPLGGVAVIADNTWAAFEGRHKLNIVWDNGSNESYNSDAYRKELQKTARTPGKVIRGEGDVDAVFAKGEDVFGQITARNGAIEQSNFSDYPVARINEAPYQTNVHMVESDAPPAGIGEPGVPPFVPAMCKQCLRQQGSASASCRSVERT